MVDIAIVSLRFFPRTVVGRYRLTPSPVGNHFRKTVMSHNRKGVLTTYPGQPISDQLLLDSQVFAKRLRRNVLQISGPLDRRKRCRRAAWRRGYLTGGGPAR